MAKIMLKLSSILRVASISTAGVLVISLASCGGNNSSSASSSLAPITGSHPLNDTGTRFCRDNTGELIDCLVSAPQDGSHGRDYAALKGELAKTGAGPAGFDWSKVAWDGSVLAQQSEHWLGDGSEAAGTRWACVQDHHTGLLWEVKSGLEDHPQYASLRYSWYVPDASRNGGNAGLENSDDCNGIACNTLAYIEYLNSENYCGHNNWRLPTVNELMTLVVTDNIDLAMDSNYFPNAKNDQYWSNQSYAPIRERAWYLYFSDGSTGSTIKEAPNFLRLVADSHRATEESP
ncbi:MAG TPA: DUF1566 domain-containing protein [Marinagarivorans sp.]